MDANIDHLRRLLDQLKHLGFFDRVFNWKQVHNGLIDASADLQRLVSTLSFQNEQVSGLETKLAAQIENAGSLSVRKRELETEAAILKNELQSLRVSYGSLRDENTRMLENEASLRQQQEKAMSALTQVHQKVESERAKEIEIKNLAEIDRLKNLKETWNRHEEHAKAIVRSICNRHSIEYIDKVPFRGDPDNTLMICNEYVVFDAKSPGGDNLTNFSAYLRDQAEKAKKYAKQENVKTDIFFIVPTNALDHLQTFVYKHSDHNVYIISVDALEPVILSLKKLEEYEFADQLSPEDRENICRVLGRFAHLSKRRIQVDSFFARQFIELAYKCESDLAPEILESMIAFEKTGKLNPPMEKRAKAIPLLEIETEIQKIRNDANGRGIIVEDEAMADLLNGLPLLKSDL